MQRERESWLSVVQDAEGHQETELVTLEGASGRAGAVIELTSGQRITLTEPADVTADWPGKAA